jgi:cellulose synthase/poly-beta-1,6-N-acetylglucosamine synthase-like glycosyltransferase
MIFMPLVSIIIPPHNKGPYIRETLESVQVQHFPKEQWGLPVDKAADSACFFRKTCPWNEVKGKLPNDYISDSTNYSVQIA